MSLITETEEYIKKIVNDLGYNLNSVVIERCNILELGQFQVNFAMKLAKENHKNPIEIANEVISKFDERFTKVNIAGPGFINFSFSDDILIKYVNEYACDFEKNIDNKMNKIIIIDYGAANAAKALHVGHMRSANIGESLKRLAKLFGNNVIGDVHLGDLGRQSGMLISQLMIEQPDLPFFDEKYKGEYPKINITAADLGRMYPLANKAAKEDEERMKLVREITAQIDKGHKAYTELWKQIVDVSTITIKEMYDKLNCNFDLWLGELSSMKYVDKTVEVLKPYLYESEGAYIIDVKKDDDNTEVPPLIVIKSDGATIYSTRDLATIYQRMKDFNPDEIWYVVDTRQSLYFEQVFRASYKSKLVPKTTLLKHYGFGTINGSDNKPFKTRDGGVMELSDLIDMLRIEIEKKIKINITGKERDDIADKLTIATLKYADLLPYRKTDYIFDPVKFSSLEGKTGPYILYGMVRIKSLFNKIDIKNTTFKTISNNDVREIIVKLIELPKILINSYEEASLNYITEYLYDLMNLFNKFYSNNNVINEKNEDIKESYILLIKYVYNVCHELLNILAIEEVEKM